MAFTRTSAQALPAPMPFVVPLNTTGSRRLSPPYHVPFRVRWRSSRCFAAANRRVVFADPGHVTPRQGAVWCSPSTIWFLLTGLDLRAARCHLVCAHTKK